MKKLWALIATAAFVMVWQSFAASNTLVPMTGAGLSGPVASNYTGPGDVVSGATIWIGLRAYSNAIAAAATQKVINISRASDSHTCDLIVTTNGGLGNTANCSNGADNAETAATFCNATTCTITEFYDQTGNGNHFTQATVADQPTLSLSCIGSLPCATFDGSDDLMNNVNTLTLSQPLTTADVEERTGNTSAESIMFAIDPQLVLEGFANSANTAEMYAGTPGLHATANDNTFHSIISAFNGASSVLYINGSGTSGNAGTNNASHTPELADDFFSAICTCSFSEGGVWGSQFSSGQASSMSSNQRGYWGF